MSWSGDGAETPSRLQVDGFEPARRGRHAPRSVSVHRDTDGERTTASELAEAKRCSVVGRVTSFWGACKKVRGGRGPTRMKTKLLVKKRKKKKKKKQLRL